MILAELRVGALMAVISTNTKKTLDWKVVAAQETETICTVLRNIHRLKNSSK